MTATGNKSWVEPLARAGYAVRGVVYGLIGILAFQLVIGIGGSTTGARGALKEISEPSFGWILLIIIAIGLAGYAIWLFVEGFVDPENKGNDLKGIIRRTGNVIGGITYGFLAVFAILIVLGGSNNQSGSSSGPQEITAKIMSVPFGRLIIGLAGVVFIGAGIYQFMTAYKGKFKDNLKLSRMKSSIQRWVIWSGKFGLILRSFIYGIIGIFLIEAAVNYDPQEAGGLQKAFEELLNQPYGASLLGIVALGFIAYGIFSEVLAKYRRIEVSRSWSQ